MAYRLNDLCVWVCRDRVLVHKGHLGSGDTHRSDPGGRKAALQFRLEPSTAGLCAPAAAHGALAMVATQPHELGSLAVGQ